MIAEVRDGRRRRVGSRPVSPCSIPRSRPGSRRAGIWLEDLYVPPAHRRAGVGAALLAHLASITVARGCARLEWAALDWNELALGFYDKIGARRLDAWVLHRLDGAALARVAGEPSRVG